MPKISTYTQKTTPVLSDNLIWNDSEDPNLQTKTKRFSLSSIASVIFWDKDTSDLSESGDNRYYTAEREGEVAKLEWGNTFSWTQRIWVPWQKLGLINLWHTGAWGFRSAFIIQDINGNFTIQNQEAWYIRFSTSDTPKMSITGIWNVWIGTTSPIKKLEVSWTSWYTNTSDMWDTDLDFASRGYVNDLTNWTLTSSEYVTFVASTTQQYLDTAIYSTPFNDDWFTPDITVQKHGTINVDFEGQVDWSGWNWVFTIQKNWVDILPSALTISNSTTWSAYQSSTTQQITVEPWDTIRVEMNETWNLSFLRVRNIKVSFDRVTTNDIY